MGGLPRAPLVGDPKPRGYSGCSPIWEVRTYLWGRLRGRSWARQSCKICRSSPGPACTTSWHWLCMSVLSHMLSSLMLLAILGVFIPWKQVSATSRYFPTPPSTLQGLVVKHLSKHKEASKQTHLSAPLCPWPWWGDILLLEGMSRGIWMKRLTIIRAFKGGCQHDILWARWDQSHLRGHSSVSDKIPDNWDSRSLASLMPPSPILKLDRVPSSGNATLN